VMLRFIILSFGCSVWIALYVCVWKSWTAS